jgi:hypothetical protein
MRRLDDPPAPSACPPPIETPADRKIKLEIENLVERRSLEKKKLEQEISELEAAPRRARRTFFVSAFSAGLSALTAFIVAIASGYITLLVNQYTNQQHDADVYTKLLAGLGSSNVPARAGAVVGLTRFARSDPDRGTQTITILVTQLTDEKDSRVLRILVPSVLSLGGRAFGEIVQLNRTSLSAFVESSQAFVRLSMPGLDHFFAVPERTRGVEMKRAMDDGFDALKGPITADIDADFPTNKELNLSFERSPTFSRRREQIAKVLQDVAAGLDGTFGLLDQLLPLQSKWEAGKRLYESPEELKRQKEEAIKTAVKSARELYLSSIILSRMLRGMQTVPNNLDDLGLIVADFNNMSFPNIDLSDTFIAGEANFANFSEANLAYANLDDLDVWNANFKFASLHKAALPSVSLGQDSSVTTADLTGADWWDSERPGRPMGASVEFVFKGNKIVETSRVSTCPYAEAGQSIAENQTSVDDQTLSISFCPLTDILITREKDLKDFLERKFSRAVNEPLEKAHSEELSSHRMQKDDFLRVKPRLHLQQVQETTPP